MTQSAEVDFNNFIEEMRTAVAHVDANADPMPPNIDHNNGLEVWRELLENLQPAEMSGVQDLAEGFETFSQAAEKQALLEAELSKLRAELLKPRSRLSIKALRWWPWRSTGTRPPPHPRRSWPR